MAIGAGQLNRRVAIERKIAGDDGHGGRGEAVWTPISYAWVKGTPFGGQESMQAGTLEASEKWRIVMRRRDVRTEDRFRPIGRGWAGMRAEARLNIRSVADLEGERGFLTLLCDTLATA